MFSTKLTGGSERASDLHKFNVHAAGKPSYNMTTVSDHYNWRQAPLAITKNLKLKQLLALQK